MPSPRLLRRSFWGFLLALFVLALPAHGQECPTLTWADEFDGTSLDETKWSYQIGDGCDIGLCGWGNNELQSYQKDNVTVSGGLLTIEAREERVQSRAYTSGRIRTLNKGEFTYGRMEARIKIPQGQGIWPAFWMLPTDEVYGGWPQSGEIDIMENVGNELNTIHGTIHFGDPYPDNQNSGESYTKTKNEPIFADGFHEFAIEREPGEIRWYVDDVLYATKTTADTDPFVWPFDERFHFLLNVAVGGNWPGDPDETTVFPQTMEVDYVRVYDGYFPHLSGERVVRNQEQGVTYSVGNVASGTSVNWTVPSGATIVSGQGTPTVTVDWGSTGGDVVADFSDGCGTQQLPITVEVEPPYVQDFAFENFDDPAQATLSSTTGTLTEVANPDASGINASATSGQYERNGTEAYDLMVYNTASITDASAYVTKDRKFVMDLYTTAPVGTEVLIQLEDADTATSSNFPDGRHSRYSAVTTTQNEWERLVFTLVDQPDAETPDDAVEDIVILFAPNTTTSDTYTFDNLDSYRVDDGTSGGGGDDGATATTSHVSSIVLGEASAGKGQKRGTATVTVVDDQGNPVSNATVAGTFSGAFSESASGATGSDGTVTLTTTGTAKGNFTFDFCVDDVTHADLTYDATANVQTCGGGGKAASARAQAFDFTLRQSYPNPAHTSARIQYTLPEGGPVTLEVYNILGERVAVLVDRVQERGEHAVTLTTDRLPSGPYLYRLTAGTQQESRFMTVVK